MEDSNVMVFAVGVAMLLLVVSKLGSLLVTKNKKSKLNLPPGPWTLPLIGSVHHLVSNPVIHRGLRDLSRKHGSLMMLRLGEVPTLVVSSAEAAETVTKMHDIAFADRYVNATLAVLTFNGTDFAFGAYGERWRQLRKICVLELLSAARVRSFQRVREEEVVRFLGSLAASASVGAAVDLTKMISRLINDTFVMECIGSRYEHRDEYLDALATGVQQTSVLTMADLFPSSRLMQMLGTAPRKALACRNRITRILDEIIREKREAMAMDRGDKAEAHDGLLSVLLKLQKEDTLPIPLTNDTIVALMFDLFGAGSDTSSTTLNWCMTQLVRHPVAMSRAQAEVREAFKGKSALTEDDLAAAELDYLKLVVKETLRLHCPVPLLIPRRCRETVQVMGYDVPKGTAVFVNVWAVCRDPKYWDATAEEFRPERFEEKTKSSGVDFKGTNYEFLPFGSGRRMCPGVNLGLANIELALASLLYHFDWKLPRGMEPKDVDDGEAAGLILKKKTGLVLHPIIRFAPASA
ncbi:dolabradiene monooxygenase-like [Miscanthus floridulus]|uniref:dolabradiene monooxygenase-like n=1 Tax=Miscanthus floridulus TaxID=154761 RepID=UPI003459029E